MSDETVRTLFGAKVILTGGVVATGFMLDYFSHWYIHFGRAAPIIDMNNLNYAGIPDANHTNPVFDQFICPITLEPIRFPVTAPNTTGGPDHHFERKAIVQWLQSHPTNPVNREDLYLDELRENLQMRAIIETEMRNLGIPL